MCCAPGSGPGGRVVGVDRKPRILDAARQVAAQRGLPIEFVPGDAADSAPPPDSFDFVHEHTVLPNVHYPVRVVAEMIRIAWPGGLGKRPTPPAGCATRRTRRGECQ